VLSFTPNKNEYINKDSIKFRCDNRYGLSHSYDTVTCVRALFDNGTVYGVWDKPMPVCKVSIYLLPHSLNYSLPHSPIHFVTNTHSITHPFTLSQILTQSLTQSLTHKYSLNHSLSHLLTNTHSKSQVY